MTVEECYNMLGGSFERIKNRLPSIGLIKKFVAKFLNDRSFDELCLAMQNGERMEAFRAAHTLKGVCANLCFDRLLSSVEQLTELLRTESETIHPNAFSLLEDVKKDHELTVNAINTYLASEDVAL